MRITIDPGRVTLKVMDAWKKGLPILTSEILRDCNEFCKFDTGTLRASASTSSDILGGKIRWSTPYARRQYWEIPTAYAAGTQWQWCEGAKGAYSQRWADQAEQLLKMNL